MFKYLLIALTILILFLGAKYYFQNLNHENLNNQNNGNFINTIVDKNLYTNTEFGFSLNLNENWINNYSVSISSIPFGNLINFENTKYKKGEYMNISILVYPKTKWQEWEKNNFEGYPTAAPIGPTKRGENEKYVFATAPRYNYSFLNGYEEVETIIQTLKGIN
jgi:hypothetical protein